eukprot:gene7322-7534_t
MQQTLLQMESRRTAAEMVKHNLSMPHVQHLPLLPLPVAAATPSSAPAVNRKATTLSAYCEPPPAASRSPSPAAASAATGGAAAAGQLPISDNSTPLPASPLIKHTASNGGCGPVSAAAERLLPLIAGKHSIGSIGSGAELGDREGCSLQAQTPAAAAGDVTVRVSSEVRADSEADGHGCRAGKGSVHGAGAGAGSSLQTAGPIKGYVVQGCEGDDLGRPADGLNNPTGVASPAGGFAGVAGAVSAEWGLMSHHKAVASELLVGAWQELT